MFVFVILFRRRPHSPFHNVSTFTRDMLSWPKMTKLLTKALRLVVTNRVEANTTRKAAIRKSVIAEAADIKDTTMGDFVREQSLTAEQHVIVDHAQFRLPEKHWKKFCDALDAPVKTIPALLSIVACRRSRTIGTRKYERRSIGRLH